MAAEEFVDFILTGPQGLASYVQDVYLDWAVGTVAAADVLGLCPNISTLTLRPTLRIREEDEEVNPLLEPLDKLVHLRSLYITLWSLTEDFIIHLPDLHFFRRLTHLHLHLNDMNWQTWPLGLNELTETTHLSLFWLMCRFSVSSLRGFLTLPGVQVVVIWITSDQSVRRLWEWLTLVNFRDARIVCLRYPSFRSPGSNGFWDFVEGIVNERHQNNSKFAHQPGSLNI